MTRFKKSVERFCIGLAALLLILMPPAASAWNLIIPGVSADSTAAGGVNYPTGSDAKTYIYNSSTGLWENDYYTYNPATQQTTPKQPLEYTYNASTGLWDSLVWEFHPNVNKYEQVTVSVATPPDGAITHGGPAPVAAPDTTKPADPTANHSTTAPPAASSELDVDNTTGTTLNNAITSTVTTGNATGVNNYSVGNATSGNATAVANVINLLQSSASLTDPNLATFTRDIQGDVNGDLLIDPPALLQAAAAPDALPADTDVDINNAVTAGITNNIDLSTQSGNATLDKNYTAGNATSGTAAAVANVVNLINSVIAANQSFLGVVNIYGNYTGNILVPQATLDSLLASNAPAPADATHQAALAAAHVTNTATQSITNNVDLGAATGSVTQSDNTATGSATSGSAMTNLTILNLTNHQVDAANSLLVFVNVLGKWVGVIMDAPAGATSAALTGGASRAAQNASTGGDLSASNTTDASIVNNITAHAVSGDATMTDNYHSGDATSGDASASANIVNMINSAFNVSHWFGILFINVFGSWLGNFGVAAPDSATINPPALSTSGGTSGTTAPAVFRFVPSSAAGGSGGGLQPVDQASFANDAQYQQFVNKVSGVLAAHDIKPNNTPPKSSSGTVQFAGMSLALLPIALGLTGFTALGAEKIHSIRKRAQLAVAV